MRLTICDELDWNMFFFFSNFNEPKVYSLAENEHRKFIQFANFNRFGEIYLPRHSFAQDYYYNVVVYFPKESNQRIDALNEEMNGRNFHA